MTSYTTLVNVDAETALKVSQFVSKLLPAAEQDSFLTECKTLIDSTKAGDLIEKILEHRDTIFNTLTDDDDIESCFQAIFSIMYTLGDGGSAETESAIRAIIAAITSDTQLRPKARLSVLVALLNITFSGSSKFEVLKSILSYARATKQTALVVHLHSKLGGWVQDWGLSAEQQCALQQDMAAVLQAEGQAAEALRALVQLFKVTGMGAGAVRGLDMQALMCTALASALKTPVDALEDRAALLEALSGQTAQGKAAVLLQLLRILCEGSLQDFKEFRSSAEAAAAFKEHGLQADELDRAMHLLSVCSAAASAVGGAAGTTGTGRTLRVEALQEALQVEDAAEVELWVIEAISERLIEGSIDQLAGTVTVTRYAHRAFGPAQWRSLQQQLRALRKSTAGVVDTVQRSKPVAPALTMA